ncbi:hypothetical protein [Enterococcus sp. AZ194]|uniref:hypothetical protein n=1 Tax=Enterococcus sp. AZ194 TaxID=2774629 RepID=UPI003F68681F
MKSRRNEAKEKDNDDYTVTIDIEPLIVFDTYQADLEKFQGELMKRVLSSGEASSDEDITTQVFDEIYGLLNKKIKTPTYGEKSSVEITVKKNDNNTYKISDSDSTKIEQKLFDSENAVF